MFLIGALMTRPVSICLQRENEMLDYVNVTPLFEPIVNWANYAPYESSEAGRERSSKHTRPTDVKGEPFELFVSKTGVYAPTSIEDSKLDKFFTRVSSREPAANPSHYAQGAGPNAEIDNIAKQRVKLMATKYASNSASAEIVARLEILNQRLLDRSPRVSQVQVEALEQASEKLARISMAREERSRRLGISA